ncbi:hypothetical protein NFI96_026076 [Prochilodus magdalenae]|nr:hypothetical protein NFI96_026076 [Prochilodus magdalenae]
MTSSAKSIKGLRSLNRSHYAADHLRGHTCSNTWKEEENKRDRRRRRRRSKTDKLSQKFPEDKDIQGGDESKRGKKFLKKLKKIRGRFSNNRIRPVEEKQGTSGVDGVDTEEPETTSISGFDNIEHSTTKKRVHFEPTPPTSTEMETENTKNAPCDQQEERAENTCSETVQIIRAKVIQTLLRLLEEQDRRASVATVIMEEPKSTTVVMDDSLWARVKSKVSKFPSIKEYAHRILENRFFSGFITFMIIFSFLVIIVESEISDRPHLDVANQVCSMLNWLIVATFYLEILLKMIVDFRQFWRNMWNIFDVIVTSLSVLPEIVTAFSGAGTQSLKIVKLIRTFRVLHVLKITAKFRELRVTVLAVTKVCKELVPVCVLLFFLMYMFAVTGSTLFRGYAQSDVQNLTYSKSFVGMSNTLSTLFILFTNNQCGSLLKEMHRVPELNYTACYINEDSGSSLPSIYAISWRDTW